MRVAAGRDDPDEINHIRAELSDFAEREGFALDQVFVEQLASHDSAFDVLIEQLKRAEAQLELYTANLARMKEENDKLTARVATLEARRRK